jgi:hypothetical protein
MSMKNSNETSGNRTRELPACSAVLQQLRHPVTPQFIPVPSKFNNLPKSSLLFGDKNI